MSTTTQPTPTPSGWFRDPSVPNALRFWDGTGFTEHFVPDPPSGNGAAGLSPVATVPPTAAQSDQTAGAEQSEASLIGRFVALLTPLFAVAAGWIASVVANAIPGVTLDSGQITAFMIAAATAVLGASWKWLQGWQEHERRVAAGQEPPRKAAKPSSS